MTPEQLDDIEARANAATEGPWERGDVWHWAGVLAEKFGEGRCAWCQVDGEPVWIGEADINGRQMLAHQHRDPTPYAYDHYISNEHGLVAGPYGYEEGGVIDPADTEFIVHARTDVPALVAVVERQRAAIAAVRHITRNADHRESQVPALIDEALDTALREAV